MWVASLQILGLFPLRLSIVNAKCSVHKTVRIQALLARREREWKCATSLVNNLRSAAVSYGKRASGIFWGCGTSAPSVLLMCSAAGI